MQGLLRTSSHLPHNLTLNALILDVILQVPIPSFVTTVIARLGLARQLDCVPSENQWQNHLK